MNCIYCNIPYIELEVFYNPKINKVVCSECLMPQNLREKSNNTFIFHIDMISDKDNLFGERIIVKDFIEEEKKFFCVYNIILWKRKKKFEASEIFTVYIKEKKPQMYLSKQNVKEIIMVLEGDNFKIIKTLKQEKLERAMMLLFYPIFL